MNTMTQRWILQSDDPAPTPPVPASVEYHRVYAGARRGILRGIVAIALLVIGLIGFAVLMDATIGDRRPGVVRTFRSFDTVEAGSRRTVVGLVDPVLHAPATCALRRAAEVVALRGGALPLRSVR